MSVPFRKDLSVEIAHVMILKSMITVYYQLSGNVRPDLTSAVEVSR